MPVSHKSNFFRVQDILLFLLFLDTFHIQKWLETVKRQNPLSIQRISSILLFLDPFRIQKCPETVKRQNPLK